MQCSSTLPMTRRKIKTILKHPSGLVSANTKEATTTQRNLFRALVSEAQKQAETAGDNKEYIFKIPVQDIKDIIGEQWLKAYDIVLYLKPLMEIRYVYNLLNKDRKAVWVMGSPLSAVQASDEFDFIEYSFNPFLFHLMLRPSVYTNMDMMMINRISIERADIVYSLLVDYIDLGIVPYIELSKLREILSLSIDKYIDFTDLRRYVLDPAVAEINEKTDINCKYEIIRGRYNACKGIQWFVEAKPGCEPTKSAPDPTKRTQRVKGEKSKINEPFDDTSFTEEEKRRKKEVEDSLIAEGAIVSTPRKDNDSRPLVEEIDDWDDDLL